jgi:hypothetical protein
VNDDEQMRTNIHALSGIQTHGLSGQAMKAYTSDSTALGPASILGILSWDKEQFICLLENKVGSRKKESMFIRTASQKITKPICLSLICLCLPKESDSRSLVWENS